jgi:hypothetical protein
MMLVLALALQAAPPLLQADAEAGSARSAEEIAAAALAACAAEQEATRRAVIAFSGEARGAGQMIILLRGNREGLIGRVRERRRRAEAGNGAGADAGQTYEAAARTWAQCTKNHVDSVPATRGREREIVAAAFAACTGEEAAVRAAALRMLGSESQTERLMIEARTIARDAMRGYLRQRRR